MATPHAAGEAASFEQRGELLERVERATVQAFDGLGLEQRRVAAQFAVVFGDDFGDALRAAKGRRDLGGSMKARDLVAQALGQVDVEVAAAGEAFEQGVLREASHYHHPVQRVLTATIEHQPAGAGAVDRAHLQIQRRRSAAIHHQFGATGPLAALAAAKV